MTSETEKFSAERDASTPQIAVDVEFAEINKAWFNRYIYAVMLVANSVTNDM